MDGTIKIKEGERRFFYLVFGTFFFYEEVTYMSRRNRLEFRKSLRERERERQENAQSRSFMTSIGKIWFN